MSIYNADRPMFFYVHCSNGDATLASQPQSPSHETSSTPGDITSPDVSLPATPQPPPKKRKKNMPSDVDDAIVKYLQERQTQNSQQQQQQQQQQDEEEHFGKNIAAVMRRFTNRQKAVAKLQIQQVLLNVEFGYGGHATTQRPSSNVDYMHGTQGEAPRASPDYGTHADASSIPPGFSDFHY